MDSYETPRPKRGTSQERESLKKKLEKLESELARVQSKLEQTQSHYHKVEEDCLAMSSKMKALEGRINGEFKRELAVQLRGTTAMKALLDTRTAELQAAQAFLDRVDDVADSDVLRLVSTLNARVYQTAASISEAYQVRCGVSQDDVEDASVMVSQSDMLSDTVLETLRLTSRKGDSVLLQTGIESMLVTCAHILCSFWVAPGNQMEHLHEQVYKSRAETQPVAGRWRAIYRSHLRNIHPPEGDLQSFVEGLLVNLLAALLHVCGVPDAAEDLCGELHRTSGKALHDIVQLALEFRRIVGEAVVSRNFLATIVPSGECFDEVEMEDEWADPKKTKRREVEDPAVLCTTGLGLVREVTEADGRHVALLVKPKVVLSSVLGSL
ncbi:uncharacterized protein BXZ73DRAFT_43235 [Epithele typhae]|uniref:uncharacterized protein n=1 Tax=Epithele typhae TaxID=378194 RepID=UPI0020089CE2|nr:uncharacterized protein BXZ73DRAFT_43235 [Epithele typhae]KAH9940119.1 hypothetical protein BXZ73DRAFT_43235 [Epithele typhae]